MNSILLNELRAFDIYLEHDSPTEILVIDLLNEEKCLSFLYKQMIEIKAPELSVVASMLSKRYAYLVVPFLYYLPVVIRKKQAPMLKKEVQRKKKLATG